MMNKNNNYKPEHVPEVEITRIASHPTRGTIGGVKVDGVPICWSLERPDLLNRPFISCIPAGEYLCTKYEDPEKRPEAWRVHEVEGRSGILFHIANFISELFGCITLGKSLRDDGGVSQSTLAFKEFNNALGDATQFKLVIKNVF